MEKENYSQNNNVETKQCIGGDRSDEGNTKEWNQRKRGNTRTIERRQTSLENR